MFKKIEISHKTIIFTVSFLIFLWFLFFIRDIIMQFFVALLLMAILNPMVARLSRFRVPRALSVLLTYLLVFGLFGVVLAGIIPALVEQTTSFINNLPAYLNNLGLSGAVSERLMEQVLAQLVSLPGQLVKVGVSVFSNILSVITVLIFAFYLLLARDKIDDQLSIFFGQEKKKEIGRLIDLLEIKLGGWARAELTLMVLVGVFTFVGLVLLGIPFALPLSILAGLLEIIPTLGPILSAVPTVLIGFSISPLMGFATAALAFLVQQVENYVFVPRVMQKSAGVSPIITLLALAIGLRLIGLVGAVIAVPVVLAIQVLTKEYLLSKD